MNERYYDEDDPFKGLEYCEFCDAYCSDPCLDFEEARERCPDDPFVF